MGKRQSTKNQGKSLGKARESMRKGGTTPAKVWELFQLRFGDPEEAAKAARSEVRNRSHELTRQAELEAGERLVIQFGKDLLLGKETVSGAMKASIAQARQRGHRHFHDVPVERLLKEIEQKRTIALKAIADPQCAYDMAANGSLPIKETLMLLHQSGHEHAWRKQIKDRVCEGQEHFERAQEQKAIKTRADQFRRAQARCQEMGAKLNLGRRKAGGILMDGRNAADK